MSSQCELTGIKVQYGNNVSHSQRKTRRRFEPNIRTVVYKSELTGQNYRLKIIAKTMRTVEKHGGIDNFMLKADSSLLSTRAKKLQRDIKQKSIANQK